MTSRNTTVAAVLASAAVAGVAVGVLIHGVTDAGATPGAGGSGAATSPATSPGATAGSRPSTPSSGSSAPTSPTRVATTSAASTSLPAGPAPARAALSEKDLMVANDYLAAGFGTARLHTGEGAGQATITACQTTNPEGQYGLKRMYSSTVEAGDLHADQWVLDFREAADAQQMLSAVVDWRTLCTDPSNEGMKGVTFSATRATQVTLADGSEGQRWTMDFEQDNHALRQAVAVVRTGTRVSVSVVSASPALVEGVDAETLAERSATRLG
ncbi:hypothetical protein [Terracoccus sp. 273MFTsu3.1]|uniref:hypothetical protein n=1 Tax=Terracoccus sp. 273MFTsu3.1 TaxID=1172188 RepID=UPI0003725E80|nr:hypothetical protein [Terracoccus sp. 273MFTsu3.1]